MGGFRYVVKYGAYVFIHFFGGGSDDETNKVRSDRTSTLPGAQVQRGLGSRLFVNPGIRLQ